MSARPRPPPPCAGAAPPDRRRPRRRRFAQSSVSPGALRPPPRPRPRASFPTCLCFAPWQVAPPPPPHSPPPCPAPSVCPHCLAAHAPAPLIGSVWPPRLPRCAHQHKKRKRAPCCRAAPLAAAGRRARARALAHGLPQQPPPAAARRAPCSAPPRRHAGARRPHAKGPPPRPRAPAPNTRTDLWQRKGPPSAPRSRPSPRAPPSPCTRPECVPLMRPSRPPARGLPSCLAAPQPAARPPPAHPQQRPPPPAPPARARPAGRRRARRPRTRRARAPIGRALKPVDAPLCPYLRVNRTCKNAVEAGQPAGCTNTANTLAHTAHSTLTRAHAHHTQIRARRRGACGARPLRAWAPLPALGAIPGVGLAPGARRRAPRGRGWSAPRSAGARGRLVPPPSVAAPLDPPRPAHPL